MSLYCTLATYFENKLKIFIELKATKCCCTTLSVDHSQPRNNCSFAHKGSLVPVHSLVCSAHPGVAHCRCAVAVLGMAFGSGNAAVNRINTFASFYLQLSAFRASVVAQLVKNPPALQETWVRSVAWEDPLEKGKTTYSSILAWRIPWTV